MSRRLRRVPIVIVLLAALVAGASTAIAQTPGYGNICSTHWGWCPLNPNVMVIVGRPCQCQAYSGQLLPGQVRQFPYENYGRPVSPYLNPHWTDPPPPPPLLK